MAMLARSGELYGYGKTDYTKLGDDRHMMYPYFGSIHLIVLFNVLRTTFAWHRGSNGCGKPLPHGLSPGGPSKNFTTYSHSQKGVGERQYLLYLPLRFSVKNNKPAPVVFAFHGQTQPTWSIESITNLSVPYFNQDAIVVYPEGVYYKSPGVSARSAT